MYTKIKSYLDLTRIHFAPVWPLLFVTGLMLAFRNYGDFSWILTLKVACIGLFGFEAGMVLNDIFDARYDERDVEFDKLTRYWRPFGKRPIPSNQISRLNAIILAIIFFIIALLIGLIYY
jgi:4-hydroxybenzoate polyprenyltransferase